MSEAYPPVPVAADVEEEGVTFLEGTARSEPRTRSSAVIAERMAQELNPVLLHLRHHHCQDVVIRHPRRRILQGKVGSTSVHCARSPQEFNLKRMLILTNVK